MERQLIKQKNAMNLTFSKHKFFAGNKQIKTQKMLKEAFECGIKVYVEVE